jgi:4-aminobutyrate aminotransferase-like enzyme/Ser/Thr protein kinase RdoA (MazF antagonist)
MKPEVEDLVSKKFSAEQIVLLAAEFYGKSVRAHQLVGELDFNFFLTDGMGNHFVLKIAHSGENLLHLQLQNAMINWLAKTNSGIPLQRIIPSLQGEEIISLPGENGNYRFMRLLTWIDGKPIAQFSPHSISLLSASGEYCGKLCKSLAGFDHPGAHRFMKWDPSQAAWIKPHLEKFDKPIREKLHRLYQWYEEIAMPVLGELRKSINYNDANDYNILVTGAANNPEIAGVIDFGDSVYTHTINELAIAIAYLAMNKPDPLAAASSVVSGFHRAFPIAEKELKVLYPLMVVRLLISVVCSFLNRLEHPGNQYLQISDQPAWALLDKLENIEPHLAESFFRDACGLTPSPKEKIYRNWLDQNQHRIISPINIIRPLWLDLSVGSLDLGNSQELSDSDNLDSGLTVMSMRNRGSTIMGRYGEARAIYSTPAFEEEGNEGPEWRTVHIGLDIFSPEETTIRCPFDGVVHSFSNNKSERDYGPTIILEHKVSEELTFYTLYGHLNEPSIKDLKVGQLINAGDSFAAVGSRKVNGNWTPHLHFQVILAMLGRKGDFIGVCKPDNSTIWKSICPDPWFLIKGESCPLVDTVSNKEIIDRRKEHLGRNLSISYSSPIRMVRGAGQYLIDQDGRRYLDTVNNVANAGHEHPRIVRAGQRQMAVLNTNTRYLHENIVNFAEALIETLPEPLSVVFVVNSGSEANELAIRLARIYTGQKDMIVSQVGYHGNTNACIEISSYKFDGKGGNGKPPHVHVIPIPDLYRGIHRSDDPDAGKQYANYVQQSIDEMKANGRKPAAFFFESVISCGGQVELPNHFLPQAYQFTRAAGGVCVADEVQTGCGRPGDHFWAFEAHGVVPDIVTIGKPIGNGHPLGAVVTTPSIANAFTNGMEYFNTFGGNPVSCAIGLEMLRVIKEEGLQENARGTGNYLKSGLKSLMKEFPVIGDVRGPGLFLGFELVVDPVTREPATPQAAYFINRMREKAILMSTDGPNNNVLKIKPPLVFDRLNADYLLESIRKVLQEDCMKIPVPNTK